MLLVVVDGIFIVIIIKEYLPEERYSILRVTVISTVKKSPLKATLFIQSVIWQLVPVKSGL